MRKKLFFFILRLLSHFQLRRISSFFEKKNLKIIFDIGSYKGEFVDVFEKYHKTAIFFLFEPSKKSFFFLKKKFNNRKNIHLINKGIADKNLLMSLNANVAANASTFSDFNESVFYYKLKQFLLGKKLTIKKEMCELITLDQFVERNGLNYIDLLKLDVEGFELRALKGSAKILRKTKYVCVEITFSNIFKNYEKKEIDNFLQRAGFKREKSYLFPMMNFEDRIYKNLSIS